MGGYTTTPVELKLDGMVRSYAMDTHDYISMSGLIAVGSFAFSIWQEKKEQEKRLSSLESSVKHMETEIKKSIEDVEKLETKIEKKIENIENKLTSIAVAISRIETMILGLNKP